MNVAAPTTAAGEKVKVRQFKAKRSTAKALKLTYFDDCAIAVEKNHILKGIIAKGETSSWIAPPGAGKSALLTEIAVHAASQRDWRGHRAKQLCGVVYFALERGDLVRRRLHAHALRDNLASLPISVADAVVDLLQESSVETIIATIDEAEDRFGIPVGMIIIDTFSKGIAANGGDEDKARDQNRAAANLRKIHQQIPIHIATVGHTGKQEDRGERGSNARVGDVDITVQISGDTIKRADVIKANDRPTGLLTEFKLDVFEFGRDEDGDPVTTAIVSDEQVVTASKPDTTKPEMTKNQATMFGLLHDAGQGGLLTEQWNERARDAGIGIKRRADLVDIRSALKSKSLVRQMGDRWTVNHGSG